MAEQVAALFAAKQPQLKKALEKAPLREQGWEFAALAQYCYAAVQRGARELLEQRGVLPPRARHDNGAEWLFWAEER